MAETSMVSVMAIGLIKKALYLTGALALYHRLRNRDTLTVVMFHRVLTPDDPRWLSCDPDYTISGDLFTQCLDFFKRHYTIVTVNQVLAARRGEAVLPPRALLVTFDDGWIDTAQHALPRLRQAGVPAVLFLIADVVGRHQAFFQERIIAAWRLGRLAPSGLAEAIAAVEGSESSRVQVGDDEMSLRESIAHLERMDEEARAKVVASLEPLLTEEHRQWITTEELRALEHGGVDIGMHGKTHVPMTRAQDLEAELSGARAIGAKLRQDGVAPATMSFPHGRYDDAIAKRAREAGFELLFTSVQALNPRRSVPWLLGRCGFETRAVTDATGRFRPELLGLFLFRKPHRALTTD
jgi:peptidoglycan/xylan/chitin deacetylase (PgdA/CDA1 family)